MGINWDKEYGYAHARRVLRDLDQGLKESASGETVDLGSFAQYVEENDD